jgi:concanavalin A-like lectin/glucanase superfamily protein
MKVFKNILLKGSCLFIFLSSLSNMGGVLLSQEIDLEEQLILYLPINSNAKDESGMNIPTIIVGPKLTTDRFGNPDQAYLFDGINDYIMLNNNEALITEKQFTICMWAKINGRSQAGDGYNNTLFEQRNDDPAVSAGIHFAAERLINTILELQSSSNSQSVTIQTDYPGDGTWYHFAAMLDEDKIMYLFIDGELKASYDFNNDGDFHTGINRVNIGSYHTASVVTGAFNGAIDEVYIYNRALNYCEIETLYSSQLLRER